MSTDNSVVRMRRRRDEAGHHSGRVFSHGSSVSPMGTMGTEGVSAGLASVSGYPGNMQQRPRDAGNRPSGTVPKEYLGIRAQVEIVNSQGPHAIGFPPDLYAGTCAECADADAARRGPAELPSETLARRGRPRA